MSITRRDLLRLSALLGIGLTVPGESARAGVPPPVGAAETLIALADTILPVTDTPGAVAAGVVPFILLMVGEWFDDVERARFWTGYNAFEAEARRRYGAGFASLKPAYRTALLTEALAVRAAPPGFADLVKRLTIFGYYTSEIGASRELSFNLAADYEPCATTDHMTHAPSLGRRFYTFSIQ